MTEEDVLEIMIEELRNQYPNGVFTKVFLSSKNLTGSEVNDLRNIVIEKLKDFGLLELAGDKRDLTFVKLTLKGKEVFDRMSLQEYQNTLRAKSKKKKEIEDLGLEKLKIDLANARRIYKTYWWTFSIAVIGLVLSLILFGLKLAGK